MTLPASEFGGEPGLIQPPPHPVVGAEAAMLERMVDPADETDSVDAVYADILAGEYPRPAPAEAAEILPLQPDVLTVQVVASDNGFGFLGVGNKDLRTVRLKVSSSPRMHPATYGPEKEVNPGVAPIVQISIGSLAPGNYYYQVLMNNLQVTDVSEVEVV